MRQPESGRSHECSCLLARLQYLDLHDPAIVAQPARHPGEHFAFVALDINLDCEGLAGERNKIIEAHDLGLVALSFWGGLDDLGKADVALRSGHQPKSPRLGAERRRMDFQIGVEQTVDQEIGAKVNAIAASS